MKKKSILKIKKHFMAVVKLYRDKCPLPGRTCFLSQLEIPNSHSFANWFKGQVYLCLISSTALGHNRL